MTVAAHQDRVSGGRNGAAQPKAGFWALTLGSIGVVYGDRNPISRVKRRPDHPSLLICS
jgi:hypothetical protein